MNFQCLMSMYYPNGVFTGGGYFRLTLSDSEAVLRSSEGNMLYLHPRDLDVDQPLIDGLSKLRKFKHYVNKYTEVYTVSDAAKLTDWSVMPSLKLKSKMFEISIITVNYNNANGLQRTLASLDSQVLENVEFIIIDGESQDASASIIEDFCANNKNSKYVSEVDSGIYDAMNKGLRLAQGKLIGFLNSGDELNDPTVLTDLREFFYHSNRPAAIYGNKKYQSQDGQITRYWKPGQFCKWKYWIGWMTPHQSTYIRNDIYKAQLFDVIQIAADYKIMFDIFYKQNNKQFILIGISLLWSREE